MTVDYTPIINDACRYFPISAAEADYLVSIIQVKKFKKKQFLVQANEPCKYDYFLVSGLVKEYFTDLGGKEFVIRFVQENDWTSDYDSYLAGKDALLNVEALENVVAFAISHQDNDKLLETYPNFEKCFRKYLQKAYSALQLRLFESHSKTVKQRYDDFMERHFDLAQRIPQHQIASYLGVTPEFLSKIRQLT